MVRLKRKMLSRIDYFTLVLKIPYKKFGGIHKTQSNQGEAYYTYVYDPIEMIEYFKSLLGIHNVSWSEVSGYGPTLRYDCVEDFNNIQIAHNKGYFGNNSLLCKDPYTVRGIIKSKAEMGVIINFSGHGCSYLYDLADRKGYTNRPLELVDSVWHEVSKTYEIRDVSITRLDLTVDVFNKTSKISPQALKRYLDKGQLQTPRKTRYVESTVNKRVKVPFRNICVVNERSYQQILAKQANTNDVLYLSLLKQISSKNGHTMYILDYERMVDTLVHELSGSTMYVGSGNELLRVYDKRLERIYSHGDATDIVDDMWVRYEFEMRGDKALKSYNHLVKASDECKAVSSIVGQRLEKFIKIKESKSVNNIIPIERRNMLKFWRSFLDDLVNQDSTRVVFTTKGTNISFLEGISKAQNYLFKSTSRCEMELLLFLRELGVDWSEYFDQKLRNGASKISLERRRQIRSEVSEMKKSKDVNKILKYVNNANNDYLLYDVDTTDVKNDVDGIIKYYSQDAHVHRQDKEYILDDETLATFEYFKE